MKTRKTIHAVSNAINTNPLDITNLHFFKIFSLPIWLAVVMSISLGFVTKPVKAESTGTEGVHPGYRYIKPKGVENTTGSASQGTKESPAAKDTNIKDSTSGDQKSQTEPVSKAAESAGTLPAFAQADKNGDHYVTKDELQDYPSLLKVFDKVDAGKDGKLEQHEFENLEMETKREGGIP
ncbi:MAG: EF-hand domain-containing protein [Methylococcales bacterium]|nr:EF-hand domain-containing protein [Methylococcales bacterium]